MCHIELTIPVPQDGKKYALQIALIEQTPAEPNQPANVIRHNLEVKRENLLMDKTADLLAAATKRVADLEERIKLQGSKQRAALTDLGQTLDLIILNLEQGRPSIALAGARTLRAGLPDNPESNPFDGQGSVQPQ